MKASLFSRKTPAPVPRQAAAEWLELAEERALTGEEQARLDAWLAADPANPAAYRDVARLYALADEHAAAAAVMSLRRAALSAGPTPRAPVWRAAAAAAAVLVIGLGWSGLAGLSETPPTAPNPMARLAEVVGARADPASAVYRTRVGERLTFTLPDGSVSTLNTDSILKVAYVDGERGVRLIRGQALFEVAKNKARPFRVYAGDRQITAVGTVFDVRLDGAKVKVALVEGSVRVAPVKPVPHAPPQQVQMTAGEVLEATRAAPMRVAAADVARTVSWKSGIVEFSGETLAQAAAEMNRYTTHPIEIADPAIGAYRVSGVFRTGEPETFAKMMSEVFPVTVTRGARGATVLTARENEKNAPS